MLAASVRILGRGIIGPFRRMHDFPHDKRDTFAIDLPDLSSSDQSIKLLSFHSGDSSFFLELIKAGGQAHFISVI